MFSYLVRVAKVPITAANFDNITVTTAGPYTHVPAAVGEPDGIVVSGLSIETDYYFAIVAVDAVGRRSDVVATSAAVSAHFNQTSVMGTGGASEEFGFQMSGAGDVDGDGKFDLVVGAYNGAHAYLYRGGGAGAPTAVTTTFSSPSVPTSFGRGVAIIGDIDKDGLDDVAVSDRLAPAHVYIWKGRKTWPTTLSTTEADYVITPDASYGNNALFGANLARLGDFNGDGIDDFVIGAQLYGTLETGRVVIVLGKVGFASLTLPDTTNTIVIDGDASLPTPQFGYRVLGLGHFYATTGGTTLIVAAPGTTAGTAGSEGRIYAFHGQTGASGAIAIGSADHMVVGSSLKMRLGNVLTNLGPMFGPLPSVGSGNPVDRSVASGSAWAFFGDVTSGPFASHVVVVQTLPAGNNGSGFFGGGISGLDKSYSLIGDGAPDLVEIPGGGSATFHIVDGRTIAGPPVPASPADVATIGTVTVPFPTGWTAAAESGATLLPDISGDAYPDFAISSALGAVPGSVVMYW